MFCALNIRLQTMQLEEGTVLGAFMGKVKNITDFMRMKTLPLMETLVTTRRKQKILKSGITSPSCRVHIYVSLQLMKSWWKNMKTFVDALKQQQRRWHCTRYCTPPSCSFNTSATLMYNLRWCILNKTIMTSAHMYMWPRGGSLKFCFYFYPTQVI